MVNEVVEMSLRGFRSLLFEEIYNELGEPGQSVDLDDLTLRKAIDEDGYNVYKQIYMDEVGNVIVAYVDKESGCKYTDPIDLFSVDEILEIINAL